MAKVLIIRSPPESSHQDRPFPSGPLENKAESSSAETFAVGRPVPCGSSKFLETGQIPLNSIEDNNALEERLTALEEGAVRQSHIPSLLAGIQDTITEMVAGIQDNITDISKGVADVAGANLQSALHTVFELVQATADNLRSDIAVLASRLDHLEQASAPSMISGKLAEGRLEQQLDGGAGGTVLEVPSGTSADASADKDILEFFWCT